MILGFPSYEARSSGPACYPSAIFPHLCEHRSPDVPYSSLVERKGAQHIGTHLWLSSAEQNRNQFAGVPRVMKGVKIVWSDAGCKLRRHAPLASSPPTQLGRRIFFSGSGWQPLMSSLLNPGRGDLAQSARAGGVFFWGGASPRGREAEVIVPNSASGKQRKQQDKCRGRMTKASMDDRAATVIMVVQQPMAPIWWSLLYILYRTSPHIAPLTP